MCIFLFAISPKGLLMPEFSNMQLWFGVGLFCGLLLFFENQTRIKWLLTAGVFMCLQILSYPSCVIVFVSTLVLLFIYADKKWKACVVFGSFCIVTGTIYLIKMLLRVGTAQFFENVKYIIQGDASHGETFSEKGVRYLQQCADIIAVFIIISVIAFVMAGIRYALKYFTGIKQSRHDCIRIWDGCFWIILLLYMLYTTFVLNKRYEYQIVYIAILGKALLRAGKCGAGEKRIFTTGVVLGVSSMLAVMILSNMPLNASLGYLMPAIMVSFIPILCRNEDCVYEIRAKSRWKLMVCVLVCLMLRYGLVILTPNDTELITNVGGIVKSGPAMGIVAEYMRAYIMNTSMEEWGNHIEQGDSIMIVGGDLVSTLGYMYGDTAVGIDSTICTPSYNEKLLKYWEINPEKYPDVVIVECWYGALKVDENTWIMNWVQDFSSNSYQDGKYWRYYYGSE